MDRSHPPSVQQIEQAWRRGLRVAGKPRHSVGELPDVLDSGRTSLRLYLLGGFDLTNEDRAVPLTISEQRIIAFLGLRGRSARRMWAAGCLWPDSSEQHANASLRSVLWRVGRHGFPIVCATRTHLWLDPRVRVDVPEMEALAGRLRDTSTEVQDSDLEALCRWSELLSDWYEDWIQSERERLRQLRLRTLEIVGECLIRVGRPGDAVRVTQAAVETEPLRESAQRLLIAACLAVGNRWVAGRYFDSYRELLGRELGVEPPADIQALFSSHGSS